jgi:thiamine biosynthesis lipoprotein
MKRALIIFGAAVFLFIVLRRSMPAPTVNALRGSAMGCEWHLSWRGGEVLPEQLEREVSDVLEHWEQVLSQWRGNSDLSRFNRGEPPTPDLARVLRAADEIKTATGGAFDHHLLEKVHAAGFGPAGTGVDLSSIGKGFGADRVGERLRQIGVRDFIFNLAGEAVAGGGKWQIGIERPDPGGRSNAETITLENQAIATSGNYRQFRHSDDGIKSHIIDPRTGLPVIRPFSAVTVIAGDCASASSWATALFVLGPDFNDTPAGMKVRWQFAQQAEPE